MKKDEKNITKLVKPDIFKAEVNLLTYPLFVLDKGKVKNRYTLKFSKTVRRDGKKLDILWEVLGTKKYGLPGPFEAEVFKALQKIISEIPKPIRNPILFTIPQLCKIMGRKYDSGWMRENIKKAINIITTVGIHSEGSFYDKEDKKWLYNEEKVFHAIDNVIWRSEKLSDGSIAEVNYLFLGEEYLKSLNAYYVKPFDYDLYKELKRPSSKRLYEILDIKFYGLKGPRWSIPYNDLCMLVPMECQKYFSDAIYVINPMHQELKEKGILSNFIYEGKEKHPKFIIHYYKGPRLITKREKEPSQPETQSAKALLLPPKIILEDVAGKYNLDYEEEMLFRIIAGNFHIRQSLLAKLLKEYGIDRLRKAYKYALDNAIKSPAGLFIKALKDNYEIPNKKKLKEKASLKKEADSCYRRNPGTCGAEVYGFTQEVCRHCKKYKEEYEPEDDFEDEPDFEYETEEQF